jgi:tetratricopeptide (TPR) repeat protein
VSGRACRYSEARGHFEDALGALAHLPDTRETKVQGIDLRLDARAALAPLGQYGQILDRMREAETLAREIGDRRRLGLVVADIGARLRNFGEHARALEASRQALDIARELEDADLAIEATYRLAQAHFAVGALVEASALFQDVAQSLTDDRRASALPPFFAAWPRAWLALTLAHLGRFTEATVHAEDAIRIAELVAHPHTVVESHAALGGVSLERGDLGTARRAFEHGVVPASGAECPRPQRPVGPGLCVCAVRAAVRGSFTPRGVGPGRSVDELEGSRSRRARRPLGGGLFRCRPGRRGPGARPNRG